MMLKRKSSPWARLKYLCVLPLAAIAVVAFARPEISRELEKISNVKISEFLPVPEKIEAKSLLTSSDSMKVKVPVVASPAPPAPPFAVGDIAENMEIDIDMPEVEIKIEKLQEKMEKLQEQMDANISVKIEDAMGEVLSQKEIDIIVAAELEKHRADIEKAIALNQKEIDALVAVEMEKHKDEIEKARKYADEHRVEIEKAKIAAIEHQETAKLAKLEAAKHKEEIVKAKEAAKKARESFDKDIEKALIYIDGVESTVEEMKKIDEADIERIEVNKGKEAVDKYGSKASNGVVLIYTKK